MSEEFRLGLDFARELDARDPLARFRERFDVRPDRVYLQANGLGLASREAEAAVQGALAAWKERAHRGWEEGVIAAMTDEVAVLMLPSAIYRSAQVLDVARLTRAAHERGILAGFDLAHSIGVAPHALDAWDVDFALWCGYKWLNGGPGAVG